MYASPPFRPQQPFQPQPTSRTHDIARKPHSPICGLMAHICLSPYISEQSSTPKHKRRSSRRNAHLQPKSTITQSPIASRSYHSSPHKRNNKCPTYTTTQSLYYARGVAAATRRRAATINSHPAKILIELSLRNNSHIAPKASTIASLVNSTTNDSIYTTTKVTPCTTCQYSYTIQKSHPK